MAIEIVDFPMKKVDLSIAMLVITRGYKPDTIRGFSRCIRPQDVGPQWAWLQKCNIDLRIEKCDVGAWVVRPGWTGSCLGAPSDPR